MIVLVLVACDDNRAPLPLDASIDDARSGNDAVAMEGNDASSPFSLHVFPEEHDFGTIVPGQEPQPVVFTVSGAAIPSGGEVFVVTTGERGQFREERSDCVTPPLTHDRPTCSFTLRPTITAAEGTHKILVHAFGSERPGATVTVKFSRPPRTQPSLGLVGHWPFDGDLLDASGNANHARFMVGRTKSTATQQPASFVPGKHGLGIKFNNPATPDEAFPTEWVEVLSSPTLQDIGWVGKFSITMWLRLDVDESTDLAPKWSPLWAVSQGLDEGWPFDVFNIGFWGGGLKANADYSQTVWNPQPFVRSRFHHVAFTSSDHENDMRLYVDGIEARVSGRSNGIELPAASLIFGARGPSKTVTDGWNGVIDDVHLYASSMSQEQVLADMNR